MISGLRKQMLEATRQQRIEKAYLFLLNEAFAMKIDLKDLIGKIIEIDKGLLEEPKRE